MSYGNLQVGKLFVLAQLCEAKCTDISVKETLVMDVLVTDILVTGHFGNQTFW